MTGPVLMFFFVNVGQYWGSVTNIARLSINVIYNNFVMQETSWHLFKTCKGQCSGYYSTVIQ
jgi:hypothetical protein